MSKEIASEAVEEMTGSENRGIDGRIGQLWQWGRLQWKNLSGMKAAGTGNRTLYGTGRIRTSDGEGPA